MLETPAGVILVTLLSPKFAVYTFPALSTAIPQGLDPVVPRMLETPSGVILVTVRSSRFDVYTFPAPSIVIHSGPLPVVPKILETPVGVILVTLLSDEFTVYTFPALSRVMPQGLFPVVPKILEPAKAFGVIEGNVLNKLMTIKKANEGKTFERGGMVFFFIEDVEWIIE